MSRIRRISPSLVLSAMALFIALGATSYALTIPRNSVGSVQIKPAAVHGSDISNGAILRSKIASGAVGSGQLGTGQVTSEKLADGSVANSKLADASVSNTKLADGSVTNTKLGTGSVTNAKLGSASVSNSKLGSSSVTAAKISINQVGSRELDTLVLRTGSVVVPASPTPGNGTYSTRSASANCVGAEQAVGFGYFWDTDLNDDELPAISARYVTTGTTPTGAKVRGGNDTGLARTLTAQVLCLSS